MKKADGGVGGGWMKKETLLIPVVCSLYLCIGPTLILLNNHLLRTLSFPFPIFLSALGVICSFIITHTLAALKVVPIKYRMSSTWEGDGEGEGVLSWRFYFTSIFPIAFFAAVTLVTGNIVYLYLSVAFIQMLKAFTPTLALLFALLFQTETNPSTALICSVLGISFGTSMAAYGEIHFSVIGVLMMLVSEIAEVMKLILSEFLLTSKGEKGLGERVNFSVFETLYFFTPASSFLMIIAFFVFEYSRFLEDHKPSFLFENLPIFFVCGFFGFLVNILSFFVVQITSSVTLKMLALARNAGLVLFCATFLGEEVTTLQLLGYSLTLGCFGWYNHIRMTKKSPEKKGSV